MSGVPASVVTPERLGHRARVLLVGKGAPERGGIPAVLELLQHSALADRHDLRFLNLARGGTPEGGRLSWGNVRRTARDLAAVRRAARWADVVHIHSALAPLVTLVRASLLALGARLRGARVVLHVHGGRFQASPGGWAMDRLLRVLLAPVDHTIAVSAEGEARLLRVLGRERVTLVVNGIDTESFAAAPPVEHHVPRILYVGLLTPRKGVVDLMSASERLRARGVAHELWLVGGTPDEGPAAEQQVRTAAGPDVVLLGPREREELPALYAQADLFCLPSWWEATPLTVLEAMASGLAVVASRVGGIPQLVAHGETGLLVPPRDPEALARAIETLLGDAAARAAMGEEGRRRVQEYGLTRMADGIDAVYRALYAGARRRRSRARPGGATGG